MRLLQPALAAVSLALALVGDAAAQNAAIIDATKPPATSPLRYRFTHVPDGVMRLDHQSGQVVFCKSAAGKWLCNAVPEEGELLKAQLQQAESDNNKLADQLGELLKQLNMPAEERAALKAAIEKAQADSAGAKSELTALREEMAALKQQLSGNRSEHDHGKLADQLGELQKQLKTPAEQGAALKAAIEKAQADSAAAKDELTALREELAALKQQLSGNRSEHDHSKLVDQLGELQKQLKTPAEQGAALKAAIEKTQADSAAAKGELTALREEIAALKQHLSGNQTEQTLKSEIGRVRGGNEALAVELAAMRKDIAALSAQLTAQKQLDVQRAETARLQAENKALNDRITVLQDETASLQKRIAELEPPRPPVPVPPPNTGESKGPQMPSREDLAAARARIAEAWRRVVEMLNEVARDLTGKSGDDSVRL